MTKTDYFIQSDFNNLSIKDKIIKVLELTDGEYDTLPDKKDSDCIYRCDENGNPCKNGRYFKTNEELSNANLLFRKMFPSYDEIAFSLKLNQFDIDKTYSDILSKCREIKIDQIF